jgi:hypothetical protein
MVSWLLLAAFGIIWAAFLFPSWRRSPTSTVEDFEQRMSLLAEANRASPGRWVLVPRKGRRFLGPQDRQRARMRRRRRLLFVALLDLIGLTLIMGMFQPFRAVLFATALLTGVLVLYVGVLIRFRALETGRAERLRGIDVSEAVAAYAPEGNGYGHSHANGYGNEGPARSGNGSFTGARNGHARGASNGLIDERYLPDHRYLREGAVAEIIDEDVHVIVRRSDEVDLRALRAANGASAE